MKGGSGLNAGDEKRLVARVKKGDSAAFRAFVELYQGRLYRTVVTMVGNREDARDLTQEVFLKAFDGIDTFRGGSSINTWLYRIAVNLCIDHIRSRKSRPVHAGLDDEFEADDGAFRTASSGEEPHSPLGNALKRERMEVISAALEELSLEHRSIIVLREIDGLSYDEIASVLGVGLGTVMSRLHYARAQLKKRLELLMSESEVPDEENAYFFRVATKEA
jgi:RNA polymerase sigma-70 factor (ECF subfamily)